MNNMHDDRRVQPASVPIPGDRSSRRHADSWQCREDVSANQHTPRTLYMHCQDAADWLRADQWNSAADS